MKIRVAIIGVGNCASSLVQGVTFYRDAKEDDQIPGLMHVNLGGYHIRDIEFTAAFDVVTTKVGKDLSEAIFAYPNNTYKFSDVPYLNVPVSRGMTHDGLGKYLSQILQKAPGPTADIIGILKEKKPMSWLVIYRWDQRWLPSGMWSKSWKPAVHLLTQSQCLSPAQNIGGEGLKNIICQSLAMTSRARLALPLRTGF
jgi:hypothetical protein